MRTVALLMVVFMLAGTASFAAAQDIDPTVDQKFTPPAGENTSDVIPDWYQRFTVPEGVDDNNQEWAGVTQTDVQLNLLQSRRWNVQLALTSRDGDTGLPREEMWAGATFNITSRLSFGGAVGVGSEELGPGADWGEQEFEAGIRLQSAFKF